MRRSRRRVSRLTPTSLWTSRASGRQAQIESDLWRARHRATPFTLPSSCAPISGGACSSSASSAFCWKGAVLDEVVADSDTIAECSSSGARRGCAAICVRQATPSPSDWRSAHRCRRHAGGRASRGGPSIGTHDLGNAIGCQRRCQCAASNCITRRGRKTGRGRTGEGLCTELSRAAAILYTPRLSEQRQHMLRKQHSAGAAELCQVSRAAAVPGTRHSAAGGQHAEEPRRLGGEVRPAWRHATCIARCRALRSEDSRCVAVWPCRPPAGLCPDAAPCSWQRCPASICWRCPWRNSRSW